MGLRWRLAHLVIAVSCVSAAAFAQAGIRGQILLPNGSPVQHPIRITLTTDNGTRTDFYFTDSNGRLALPQLTTPFTITVETDKESYETTTASFIPPHSGNYIIISLKPLKSSPAPAPGVVNAADVDRNVSRKAREAYERAAGFLQADRRVLIRKEYAVSGAG